MNISYPGLGYFQATKSEHLGELIQCWFSSVKLSLSKYPERTSRTFDIHMMALQNAKEREAEDWAWLFRNADPRFHFLGITQLGIIEARWRVS